MFDRGPIPMLRTGFRALGVQLPSAIPEDEAAGVETTAAVDLPMSAPARHRKNSVLDVAQPPLEPIDDAALRAEVVGFLDQAEARGRHRPGWIGTLDRERVRQTHEVLAELSDAKERFTEELRHERAVSRRDARLAFERSEAAAEQRVGEAAAEQRVGEAAAEQRVGEAAAEQRVGEAAAEAGRLLDVARNDARELVRRAQGEAEQTLEWSRAQGAEIVRRSQRLARDRFSNDARPWSTADVKRQ